MTEYSDYNGLKGMLLSCNDDYYNKGYSLISDKEYDTLYAQLKQIEADHPDWVKDDSPTMSVGSPVKGTLPKIQHTEKLYSLDNVFNTKALEAFLVGCEATLHMPLEYGVEIKYDGLSCVAKYEQGKLVSLATRGDGEIGENVTHKANYIKMLPLVLNENIDITVKGEVLMFYKDFEYYNQKAKERSLPMLSNPRNGAAGLLRRTGEEPFTENNISPKFLTFIPYDVMDSRELGARAILSQRSLFKYLESLGFSAHYAIRSYMSNLGFSVDPTYIHAGNLHEAQIAVTNIYEMRDKLPFPCDGSVVKVDNFISRYTLGYTSKAPKGAIAYKFPAEEVISTLEAIDIQVGRLGTLTPVARITPVEIGGVIVSNVTLHNAKYISDKDIRIGDKVIVSRRGDVIPQIENSIYEARTTELPVWTMPDVCPCCKSPVIPYQSSYLCTGDISCPDQKLYRFSHYCSKAAMDIRGIAEMTLKTFIDNGIIDKLVDLYKITDKDLNMPGMGETSVNNILSSIEASKNKPLANFLYALGIEGVGSSTAKLLAKHFGSYANIRKLVDDKDAKSKLTAIKDIGNVVADQVLNYLNKHIKDIDELVAIVKPQDSIPNKTNGILSNVKVCFTGKFLRSRKYLEELVTSLGGEVVTSVTKNLTYLICGESPSSKLAKAKSLNISIKKEEWLLGLEK